ncbi:sperm acrosome membrane-associated protein 6 [Thalassophryne amazonica]|uniref:sperm acrosome membrane-associated protein 6 n=1 Tax=Thalassophryne amazonica TaxID=390379 RepID=UPI001471B623|nr:sperm acrosome membrane-associated protein 6 [Thalassophryne amazonica]
MYAIALRFICVSLLFGFTFCCYYCFIDVYDSYDICRGFIETEYQTQSVDSCMEMLNRVFNHNQTVIEAGTVGVGYDTQLKELMEAQVALLKEEFVGQRNYDTVYEKKLQMAANNFVAAASKLPRAHGCFPPCGIQGVDKDYNCSTCMYNPCNYPLDCPIQDVEVMETDRTRMWCNVQFQLPKDIMVIWRFAQGVKTQVTDEFEEVTVGTDRLYSILFAYPEQEGTYQCEIYSQDIPIVKVYFYVTVTPSPAEARREELQELFDLYLLPGGLLVPETDDPPQQPPLSPVLLTACLTSVMLLLFLSLGALFLLPPAGNIHFAEQAGADKNI